MLQVKWEWLPGRPINISHPLTFNLHGDWTATGGEDLQGVPLVQVCKAPPTPLRSADRDAGENVSQQHQL